jgi:TetR/AcrR family transcriptional regulator, transcriptional repressor of bet genes
MLDGLFQQALLGHVAGHADALDELCQQIRDVMPLMLTS